MCTLILWTRIDGGRDLGSNVAPITIVGSQAPIDRATGFQESQVDSELGYAQDDARCFY